MKKQILTAAIVLMATNLSNVYADNTLSADASIQPFSNSLLGKWQPLPGAVSNDVPDVDRSLALFADSILGKRKAHQSAVSNDKPDVDRSLALFAGSIIHPN